METTKKDLCQTMELFGDYACNFFWDLLTKGIINENSESRILVNNESDILLLEKNDRTIPKGYEDGIGFDVALCPDRPHYACYYLPGVGMWNDDKECFE
jgi:hypothetical protein